MHDLGHVVMELGVSRVDSRHVSDGGLSRRGRDNIQLSLLKNSLVHRARIGRDIVISHKISNGLRVESLCSEVQNVRLGGLSLNLVELCGKSLGLSIIGLRVL